MLSHMGFHAKRAFLPFNYALPPWAVSLGLAVAVAVIYFLAARLSLALISRPDGVAVFWPAAGVSSGVLIGLGPAARLPVLAGTMAATFIANMLGDRSFASALVFALCNAGEAVIVAAFIYKTPDNCSKNRGHHGLTECTRRFRKSRTTSGNERVRKDSSSVRAGISSMFEGQLFQNFSSGRGPSPYTNRAHLVSEDRR